VKLRTGISVFIIILTCPRVARATEGLEPINTSMHARARGGADVAVGDTALSQIDNPASLSLQRKYRFDFSGQLLMPTMHWTGPIDKSTSRGLHPLANLAIAVPLDEKLSIGFAMQSKSGLGSDYQMRHTLIPLMDRHVYSDMKNLSLSFNAAYRLTDKLSIGAGLRGEGVTARFGAVLGPGGMDFGRGYAYGGGFQLGLHYQATDTVALGLAYRSPTWFGDLSGGGLDISMLGLPSIRVGDANIDEFRLPQKISAGVAWDATDWWKVVGEVRWTNYACSTFHDTTVATDGPIDLRFPLPVGFQDQWSFILGSEFELDEHWTLGVGYHYATAVVPRTHLFPITPATLQHHITTGLRYERDNWWVGAGYIYGFNSTIRGFGENSIPMGFEFGQSKIEHHQHSVFFGFGFSW